MNYIEAIEHQIESKILVDLAFLIAKGLNEEKTYESIQKVAEFDKKYLQEIQLLIAATDYEAYSKMMNEMYLKSKKGKKEIGEMELVWSLINNTLYYQRKAGEN